ncbi:hypothetical protein BJ508DRAFT_326943 [Ascobolus immersus RN42]|uniref:Uncharacterized protein n=1 Tax=Ascobolus immersus RN42 TaxID=1160509 RepID=A0A3N4I418_ASCIM|nr:hypothetical protein BJ508DRAFT_326943 [Ascobolus immersus RN42]
MIDHWATYNVTDQNGRKLAFDWTNCDPRDVSDEELPEGIKRRLDRLTDQYGRCLDLDWANCASPELSEKRLSESVKRRLDRYYKEYKSGLLSHLSAFRYADQHGRRLAFAIELPTPAPRAPSASVKGQLARLYREFDRLRSRPVCSSIPPIPEADIQFLYETLEAYDTAAVALEPELTRSRNSSGSLFESKKQAHARNWGKLNLSRRKSLNYLFGRGQELQRGPPPVRVQKSLATYLLWFHRELDPLLERTLSLSSHGLKRLVYGVNEAFHDAPKAALVYLQTREEAGFLRDGQCQLINLAFENQILMLSRLLPSAATRLDLWVGMEDLHFACQKFRGLLDFLSGVTGFRSERMENTTLRFLAEDGDNATEVVRVIDDTTREWFTHTEGAREFFCEAITGPDGKVLFSKAGLRAADPMKDAHNNLEASVSGRRRPGLLYPVVFEFGGAASA